MPDQPYLSDKDLARRYGVARATPWRWVREGTFPSPIRLTEHTTRWRLTDIEAFETRRAGDLRGAPSE